VSLAYPRAIITFSYSISLDSSHGSSAFICLLAALCGSSIDSGILLVDLRLSYIIRKRRFSFSELTGLAHTSSVYTEATESSHMCGAHADRFSAYFLHLYWNSGIKFRVWCGRQRYVLPLPIDLDIPLQVKMAYINHPKALSLAKIIMSLLLPIIL